MVLAVENGLPRTQELDHGTSHSARTGLDFNVHHVSFIMKDAALIALVELDHKGVSYSKAVEMAHDAYILKAEAMGSPLETSDRIAIKNHLVDLGFCIN